MPNTKLNKIEAGTASNAKNVRSHAGNSSIVSVTNRINTKNNNARRTRASINILSGRMKEYTIPPMKSATMAHIITIPM